MLEKVWFRLAPALRDRLLQECVLCANRDEGYAGDLSRLVAELTNARPQSVRGQWRLGNLQGLRIACSKAPHRAAEFLPHVLVSHHRREVAGLYDQLGIRHEQGQVCDDDTHSVPTADRFLASLERPGQDIAPDLMLAMVATIADAGIAAWRESAGQAIQRFLLPPPTPELDAPDADSPRPAGGESPVELLVDPAPLAAEATVAAPARQDTEPPQANSINPLSPHTTLDRLVIDTVVRAMHSTVGACSPEDAEELVEEIIALNDGRFTSYFHRGFLHALRGDTLHEMARGENQPRRGWYVAGFLSGCRRTDSDQAFIDRLQSLSPNDRRAIRGGGDHIPPPAPMIGPMVISAALEVDDTRIAMEWFHTAISMEAVDEVARWSLQKLRNGGHGLALPVLQRMRRHLETLERSLTGESRVEPLLQELDQARTCMIRLEATALRMAGRFDEAVESLLQIDTTAAAKSEQAAIAGGIALAKLHVPRIEQVDLRDQAIESLLRGIRHLEARLQACEAGSESYPPGLLLLALPGIVGQNAAESERTLALTRLRLASDVMALAPERWAATGATRLARGLIAFAQLCGMNETSAEAASTLAESLADGLALPTTALASAAECAALLDVPEVVVIGKHLVNVAGPSELVRLPIVDMIQQSPSFARIVVEALDAWSVPDREWAELAAAVLRGLRRARSREQGTVDQCVDGLEARASRDSRCRATLLALLRTGDEWEVGWSQEERDSVLLRLYLHDHNLDEAADLLRSLGFSALARGDRTLAEDCAEQLDRIAEDFSSQCGLRGRLAATAMQVETATGEHRHPWIALVGGNEMQAAYEGRLQQWFAERWPEGRLRIELPGWGANWMAEIEELGNKLDRYDAVILLTLVRTNLGRYVRRRASEVGIPWIACTGHGLESLRRAVSRAVSIAARKSRMAGV